MIKDTINNIEIVFPSEQFASTSSNHLFITSHEIVLDSLCKLSTSRDSLKNLPMLIINGPQGSGKHTLALYAWSKMKESSRPYKILNLEKISSSKDLKYLLYGFEYGDLILKGFPINNKTLLSTLHRWQQKFTYIRLIFHCNSTPKKFISNLFELFPNHQICQLPALGERKDDIILLVYYFLRHMPGIQLTSECFHIFRSSPWKWGGLELQTTIFYCLKILKENLSLTISKDVLKDAISHAKNQLHIQNVLESLNPNSIYATATSIGLKELFLRLESFFFHAAEKESCGNISLAARRLHLPVNTYLGKRKRHSAKFARTNSIL